MAEQNTQPDVTVRSDGGDLFLFTPNTEQAKTWIEENVCEDSQWFGDALVVEARYAPLLVHGMTGCGLDVQLG